MRLSWRPGRLAAAVALAWGATARAQGREAPAGPPALEPDARAVLAPVLRRLSEASAVKDLAEAARELPPTLERAAADGAARAAAGREARAAILAGRDRLAARLRGTLEASFRDQIPRLKAELARRREAAVGLVMDDAAYPEGGAGKAVQPRVDEKVAAVRALWENPLLALARLSPPAGRELESLNAAVADALDAAGLEARPEDAVRLETLFADPGEWAVTFRTTPLDGAERKLLDYNRRVLAANAGLTGIAPAALEQAAVTNAYREMMGRKVLEVDEKLCRAAQAHSEAMARAKALWHQGEDGTPASRLTAVKYDATAIAENVCRRYDAPREAHDAWFRSPGHHRTLLDPLFNQIGVGVADGYWTQNFGRGRVKAGGKQ